MSAQSLKTQWQIALQGSGLGLSRVGTGLAMSLHANTDGTKVFPSMTTLASRVGCSRGTLEGHRAALVVLGWLTPVVGAVPRNRGAEYRLTIPDHAGNPSMVLPETMPVFPADHAGFSETMPVFQADHAGIPRTIMPEIHHDTNNHEEHHDPTGKAAWDAACARKTAAEVALAEVMAAVPSGQEPMGKAAWDAVVARDEVEKATKAVALAEAITQAPSFE